jgi:hypothetical protein
MVKRILKITAPLPGTSGAVKGLEALVQDTTTLEVSTVHGEVLNEDWGDPGVFLAALCGEDDEIDGCP